MTPELCIFRSTIAQVSVPLTIALGADIGDAGVGDGCAEDGESTGNRASKDSKAAGTTIAVLDRRGYGTSGILPSRYSHQLVVIVGVEGRLRRVSRQALLSCVDERFGGNEEEGWKPRGARICGALATAWAASLADVAD